MTALNVMIEEVITTLPTQAAAEEFAAALVEQRLAACVQISGPILSIYRWRGSINQDQEFSLCCKTTVSRLPQLLDYLIAHHPYELPEILALSLKASNEYAHWLRDQVDATNTTK